MHDEKIIKPVIHPKSFRDEFPNGYLIRLAELNQYDRAGWLLAEHSQLKTRINPTAFFQALSESAWTGYGEESEYNLHTFIDPIYFELKRLRFCPLCVEESPYIRTKWQFRTSVICLEHKIWLRDCCSKCGSIISLAFPRISVCACGESFCSYHHVTASKDMIRMQEYMEGLRNLGDFEEPDITQRIDTLAFFSKWTRHRQPRSRLLIPSGEFNTLVDAAEALFSERSGFIAFLKKIHGLQEKSAKVKHFERFHHEFYQRFSKPSFDHLKIIIEEYINHHWTRPLNGRNINFSKATIANHPWIPLRVACRDYDIPKSTLKRALAVDLIRWDVNHKGSRKLTYLYKPDIEDRLFRIKDFITAKEAMLLLGVTKKQFYQLHQNGLFKIAMAPRETGFGTWGFSREEIYGICHKLLNGLGDAKGDVWSFSQILQYYGKKLENATSTLTNAVLAGELKPVGADPELLGFSAMYFTKESVVTWLELRKTDSKNLSIPTVAKVLRVNQEFAYQLVNRRLLKTERAKDGSRRISVQGITAFQNSYAILAKLAPSLKVSSRVLQEYLTSRGVRPVDHKWETPLRQKIYKKSHLANIEILKGIL